MTEDEKAQAVLEILTDRHPCPTCGVEMWLVMSKRPGSRRIDYECADCTPAPCYGPSQETRRD